MSNLPNKAKALVFAILFVAMYSTYFIIQPFSNQVIRWDVSLYYTYLPAVFIYQDVGMQQDWPADLHGHQVTVDRKHNGKVALKMSMGMAYTYVPFFAAGHLYALLSSSFAADGYTQPYHIAIGIGAVFWCTIGLYFLFLFLRRFVSNIAAGITVFIIIAGTNLGYYTFWEGAMSHSILFTLLAIFLEVAERYIDKQRLKYALVLGAVAGLAVLIRPILLAHFLILIGFYVYRVRGRINSKHIFFAVLMGVLWWLPQLAYWKYITGDWLYYSYTNETFFWADPKIWDGLFSWRKGWFVYTPIMLFLLPSMAVLYGKSKSWFWLIVLLFVAHVYIIFSWWCWWYGGSFGLRAMIEMYALFALPLAYFVQYLSKKSWVIKLPFAMVVLLVVAFNMFNSWQYCSGIIHHDGMTCEANKQIFLRVDFPNNYDQYLDHPDYDKARNGQRD